MSKIAVGSRVLYQPKHTEWPMAYRQHPAIVTAWDEDKQVANLTVFYDGMSYLVCVAGVAEGPDDGQELPLPTKLQEAHPSLAG